MTRTLRQFALAFVVAFSSAGVFVYAHGLNEDTIAGPSKEIEEPNACPVGYDLQETTPFLPPDKNGDGLICVGGKGTTPVDNTEVIVPETGVRHVSGHGNFESAGKVKLVQDISFSFHGIGIDTDPLDKLSFNAKGQFEFHDQSPEGADLTVHGDVVCLSVSGNRATLIGFVTRSNDLELPELHYVTWRTEDNGEGSAAPPDTMTRPSLVGTKGCGAKSKFIEPEILEIDGGNIQVHEDETSGGVPSPIEEKDPTELEKESYGVNGQGNFFEAGKKVVQDIAFSFKAVGEGEFGKFNADKVAKGDFEYRDQTIGGANLSVKGQVLCASVMEKSVTLVGVVTESNDKGLPVDTKVVWAAEEGDDVEGSVSKVSRLAPVGVNLTKGGLCDGKAPALKLQSVQNGTIYVK